MAGCGSRLLWIVLIPRPETELIVEAALERLRDRPRPVVVDVGTGSGCIALSLAGELPRAEVHATDNSEAALSVARGNAARLGLPSRVAFHLGELLEPVASLEGRIDLVASNPPYVHTSDDVAQEVRDHRRSPCSPHGPLVGLPPAGAGRRACAPPQRMADRRDRLRNGGRGVIRICEDAGLELETILPDLQSIPRTIVARRR